MVFFYFIIIIYCFFGNCILRFVGPDFFIYIFLHIYYFFWFLLCLFIFMFLFEFVCIFIVLYCICCFNCVFLAYVLLYVDVVLGCVDDTVAEYMGPLHHHVLALLHTVAPLVAPPVFYFLRTCFVVFILFILFMVFY